MQTYRAALHTYFLYTCNDFNVFILYPLIFEIFEIRTKIFFQNYVYNYSIYLLIVTRVAFSYSNSYNIFVVESRELLAVCTVY